MPLPRMILPFLLSENLSDDYLKLEKAGLLEDFIFLPLPINEAAEEAADAFSSSYCGTASIAIAANAKEPDLAWEFIKWLMTDDYASEWIVDVGRMPATYTGVDYMLKALNKSESFTKTYRTITQNFWSCFSVDQMNRVDIVLGNLEGIFNNYFVEMLNGNMTAEEAGAAMDTDFNETKNMNHK